MSIFSFKSGVAQDDELNCKGFISGAVIWGVVR
jgi:hypothetical protein